jgi:Lrp/AsnC family transcriptional regulator for asnA, asnC and gidA
MARELFDDLDVAMIKELQVDGRLSNTELARRLGVTETTVRNRINRLLSEQLIAVSAFPTAWALTQKLSVVAAVTVEPEQVQAVAQALCAHREIRYVAVTDRFAIRIEAYVDDRDDLYRLVRDRIAPLPGVIGVESEIVLRTLKYSHDWDPEADLPRSD